ncbi:MULTISPECIES: immune inhibitor A domain-containing protein [unclassified Actinoplanes]|uniref:immune inhibitor A domain-containing protein n=1 Tax=unclassified Actinoplanes TaxID=2626549 RepID=UPI0005BDC286|nr:MULTISPECIES: immune inhibitor A domain-containing protein [unclassified Actinoplanes]
MVTSVGASFPATAFAAPPVDTAPSTSADTVNVDDLPQPLEAKRRELRQQAVADVISGKAKIENRHGSQVVNLGRAPSGRGPLGHIGQNQYVELGNERTDRIFVILAEFGDQRDPAYPDKDTDPTTAGPTTFSGPLHNQIPQPDRKVDNSTIWQSDYSADHFRQMYFGTGAGAESLKTYFETQSSGRYSVGGEVTDWVKVPYNEARYGRSNDPVKDEDTTNPANDPAVCHSSTCNNTWALVRDAANAWVADQKKAGRTDAQIAEDMKSFDQYDRYDYDGDGNFNEPDGYIDHFQIVHAGGDQADGDPQQGEDAIWSHRWYAYGTDVGSTGPATNRLGGTEIGNTGIWIGDYTIQPENGGLSVFTHEYTHDLGLPDDYNTDGDHPGDNPNEYWTLMAQSRLNGRHDQGIGNRPGDLGAWNKLQLGWLNYEKVDAGQKKVVNLGPEEYNTKKKQAVVVNLPEKPVSYDMGAPAAGTKQFYSGNADNLNTSMTTTVDLTGKTTAALSLKGRYNIETGYDYQFFEASADGGTTWTKLDGTVGDKPFPRDAGGNPGLTGNGGKSWSDITVPLTAYAGKKISLRLRYVSDSGTNKGGFFGDEITVSADGATLSTDGAEGNGVWTLAGFTVIGSTVVQNYPNYYIAGYRSYTSYDKYLATGPYNFGFADKPDWVEHYNYQTGLLISYWDTSQADNNTPAHPGSGRNLYIDAHPKPFLAPDGKPWRVRVQIYDAPFGLYPTDGMLLHQAGKPSLITPQWGRTVFNDKDKYYYDELPNQGVKLPAVGVKIKVLSQLGTSMTVAVS